MWNNIVINEYYYVIIKKIYTNMLLLVHLSFLEVATLTELTIFKEKVWAHIQFLL